MKQWSLIMYSLMLLQVSFFLVAFGIPAKVANRMVPSWWYTGVTAKNICYRGSDCSEDECCARPMLSANSYCMPLKKSSEICATLPMMLYPDEEVYFGACPCNRNSTCIGLQTRSVCLNLRNFEADLKRLMYQKE